MARIRSFHPDLRTDPALGRCSFAARWLYLGLCAEADDFGVARADPERLRLQCLPGDPDADVRALIEELLAQGKLQRFEDEHGHQFLFLRDWADEQRIDRPSQAKRCPPLSALRLVNGGGSRDIDENGEGSRGLARAREDARGLALEGKGEERTREEKFSAATGAAEEEPALVGEKPAPKRSPRVAVSSETAPGFDLAPFIDAWRQRYGGDPPGGRFGKVLRRLVVTKGYGSDEVLRRWGIYLDAKGDYATPEDFAAKWDRYAEAPAVSAAAGAHHPRAVQFLELVTRNRLATCVGEQVPAQLEAMEARGEIRSAEAFFRLFARLDRNVLRNAPSPHLALRHIEETLGDDLLRPSGAGGLLVDGATGGARALPLPGAAVA